MVRELGAIIRNQIPSGRKSVLDAYGDILFRAWRECTGACLYEVENVVQASPA
jgi:condensin-2 complex subunit G2